MSLYHYPSCYFCRQVRDALAKHGFDVELRDIHQDPQWRDQLVAARGRRTVPVMRIDHEDGRVEWMPESRDIVRFLDQLANE